MDYLILIPYLALCVFSVVMVVDASYSWVTVQYRQTAASYLIKQVSFVIGGIFLAFLAMFSNRNLWRKKWFLYGLLGLTIFLLMLVLVLGKINPEFSANGASAWIPIGPFHLQPGEIAKLVVILYMADIMSMRQKTISVVTASTNTLYSYGKTIMATFGPFLILVTMMVLVFLEPDTGGFMILAVIALIMMMASGFSAAGGFGWLGFDAILAAGGFTLAVTKFPNLLAKSYQGRRFLAVMYPFKMAKDEGKQLVNSMYAINHGGLLGVGLGNGQMKAGYIPEPYTDFILSTITEELGVVGAILTVGTIIFIVARIVMIGIRARDVYHSLLMYGIATLIMIQTTFNVGAVVGLLPITGVTLPFISYGGSSLLVLSVAIGIVLNVSAREKRQRILEKDGEEHA